MLTSVRGLVLGFVGLLFVLVQIGCTRQSWSYAIRGLSLFDDDRCLTCVDRYELEETLEEELEEHAAEHSRPVLRPSEAHEPAIDARNRLRSRAPFEGGYFEVAGDPRRSQDLVVLTLRPSTPFAPAPCEVRIFRDGSELRVHQSRRERDHQFAVAIDLQALSGLSSEHTFTARACGVTMRMHAEGLATLGRFAVRFRELSAMQAHASLPALRR